jgi:hypothetical protein
MPELIHTFTGGKMNKDLDERLLPNGEYRDALNLEVASSDTSQVGAFQNLKGNTEKSYSSYNSSTKEYTTWDPAVYIDFLPNAICIGSIAEPNSDIVYWFIASDPDPVTKVKVSVIVSYNTITQVTLPLIVDTQNIFNFSADNLITGINILEGLLLWTDNQTEPKSIIIDDWVNSTPNFITHSKIYNRDFVEADTTVIRKKPLTAPSVEANASGRGGAGTGLSPLSTIRGGTYANFTYEDPNDPLVYISLPTYAEDNALGYVSINTTPAPDNYEALDMITLKGEETSLAGVLSKYEVTLLIVGPLDSAGNLQNGNTLQCHIQAISADIPRTPEIVWEVLLVESGVLFEFVFPRFATRWKYNDNQVSGFSPFTETVFVGGEFEYLSSDGFNVGMVNNAREIILSNLEWGDESVKEIEILYKASNSTAVYVVDSISDKSITSFTILNEVIGAIVNSNQLLRPYDNVPLQAKAQEITGNRLIYGGYTQQYDLVEPKIRTAIQQNNHSEAVRFPEQSLKSIRTYQIGANFLDKYGRETPVFTTNNSSFFVPVTASSKVNKAIATLAGSDIPSFATHFKYFIKDISNEYYNIALDRFYFAEDGNIWLSFPSSERNKVLEETYLVLKKEHDNNSAVPVEARFKVLAIQNEAPDFIATRLSGIAEADVEVPSSGSPTNPGVGVQRFSFKGPSTSGNARFNQGFAADNFIVIAQDTNVTREYAIASGGPVSSSDDDNITYRITLEEPLGEDALFLDSLIAEDKYTVIIKEKIVEKKPEYEGRFFAKINRDANFDNYVISSFVGFEPTYGILESIDVPDEIANRGANSSNRGFSGPGFTDPEAPSNNWQTKIRKPVAGSNWFGVGFAAYGGGQSSPINSSVSTIPLLDNYLSANNTTIRFFDSNGKKSGVYTVKSWEDYYDRRGWRTAGGAYTRTTNFNSRKSVRVVLNKDFESGFTPAGIEIIREVGVDSNDVLSSSNPAIFETEPKEAIDIDIYHQASNAIPISEYADDKTLDWFNCFSYGNGVESNRIRDDYNAVTIDKGPIVSAPLDVPYRKEIKANSLIFSQIFNSISGVNNLNQFIQAEGITKDLNPEYGSIQKLYSRDTDLITLCENKAMKILANKDALFNADGSSNVTSNKAVLGQTITYQGEYGIGTNPESFAEFGFRMYFVDSNRGTVIRLSNDGITPVSDYGMHGFFQDNLSINKKIIGSWDADTRNYNITLNTLTPYWQQTLGAGKTDRLNKDPECGAFINEYPTYSTTVSFKDDLNGWTSRKTYIPENGISLNNVYYTFKSGKIWEMNSNILRNSFYNTGPSSADIGVYYESSFNAIFNESPTSVKDFRTISYSGTDSREYIYKTTATGDKNFSLAQIQAQQLIPTDFSTTKGWYANSIVTDLQEGEVKELINKEGKYYNYIKGLPTFFVDDCDNNVDSHEFNVQGIGRASAITGDTDITVFKVTNTINPDCFTPVTPIVPIVLQYGSTESAVCCNPQTGTYYILDGEEFIDAASVLLIDGSPAADGFYIKQTN